MRQSIREPQLPEVSVAFVGEDPGLDELADSERSVVHSTEKPLHLPKPRAVESRMSAFSVERRAHTTQAVRVRDITREVGEAVRRSGVSDGICCVYSPLTTCAVRVNEFEAGFLEDFASLLTRLVPSGGARCLSMLLGPAGESIPISSGELCLGTWQRVLFVQLDGGEHEAGWQVQVLGS